ncbi:MAG: ABC transporter permease [Methanomicrobiales archaeon]|nr:ABC transporter permease [Methanomicrobiales archaeon]
MILFDYARRNIRLHWLRSFLAVIGIVIGVVAISSMGVLGNSLVLSISESLTTVGDTIVVYPQSGAGPMGGAGGGGSASLRITPRQMDEITRSVGSNIVIPVHTGADRVIVGSENRAATLYGMDPADISEILELEDGIFLRSTTGAMAGKKLAEEFELNVGSTGRIGEGGERVRIVGILKERGIGFDINPDYALVVSDRWFESTYGEEGYNLVVVKVRNLEEIDTVKKAIEDALNRRTDVVTVLDTRKVLQTILDAFNNISTFTTAIGGISLIVAGVSILNVMMMSVTERTREIGIIRSIGAKRREVMRIFLYEALVLGVIGSAIGGILSFGGAYLAVSVMLQSTTYLFVPSSLVFILYGMLFGIGTSLLSGLYPAWRAANLNPIEALRHD